MTRPLRRRPPTVRTLLAALVVLLAVTAVGWSGDPAAGQDADPSPTLRLERQTSWVGPDGVFQVTFSADDLPAGATVRAVLHPRLRSRAALDAVLTDRRPSGTSFNVRARPVSELTALDGTITVSLPVSVGPAASTDGVQLTMPGVYPFSILVYGPDDQFDPVAELVTTMLRLGDPAGQTSTRRLAVGVVVPVQTSLTLAPDGTPVLDDTGAESLTDTIDAIAARPDLPLTVSPSAEALELLSARDADGAAAVAELRTRIARQILANPYARIDTGAWVESGLSQEAVVQWLAGVTSVRGLLGTEPDYTTATLDRTVTPAALELMHQIGIRYAAVPSDQLEAVGGAAATTTFAEQFDVEAGDAGTIRGVVADDPTALRLASDEDPVLSGHDALAELALLHDLQTSDGQGVAVIVANETDPLALTTFLDGLRTRDGAASGTAGAEMISPVTLEGLFSATAVAESTRTRGDEVLVRGYRADEPGDLGRYPTALRDTNESLAGLRSLVPPDAPIAAQPAVNALSSGDRGLTADQRTAVLDSAERAIADVTGEIVVAAEQVVTLTSSSGRVPLNLENRLQVEAHVRIVMSSAKLDFPEGAVIEWDLPAQQTTTIELPVETRASGAFPLTVTISSADGTLPVATTRYTVRSTAISGVGLVLSVGAGLFLLVWWGRHFRTARRARKLVASNHPALSGTEPGGYAPADSDPKEGR